MKKAIFVSYRRDDSSAEARSIFQHLQNKFGARNVFMDVESIERGRDFRKVLDGQLRNCGAVLAIIGPSWVQSEDASGERRINNPLDFVRLEIARALKRDIPVIPVLVRGAQMPNQADMPEELRQLLYRQAISVEHESFSRDLGALEKDLSTILEDGVFTTSWLAKAAIASTAALITAVVYDLTLSDRSLLKSVPAQINGTETSGREGAPARPPSAAASSPISSAVITANSADLEFESARSAGSEAALLDFSTKHPTDPRSLEIRRAHGDRSAWQGAEAANTREAYENYIVRYPNGIYLANAKERLALILRRQEGSLTLAVPSANPAVQPSAANQYFRTSFDCYTNSAIDEQAVCRSASLAALDLQLSELFTALKSRYGQGAEFTNLRNEQRTWITARSACAADEGCLGRMYAERIRRLEARVR